MRQNNAATILKEKYLKRYESEDDEDENIAYAPMATIPVLPSRSMNQSNSRGALSPRQNNVNVNNEDGSLATASLVRPLSPGSSGQRAGREIMEVTVNIYSLNGLLRRQKKKRKRRDTKKSKENKKGDDKKDQSSSPIPTTALISADIQVLSSGFALKTFLPSLELHTVSSTTDNTNDKQGECVRCSAMWDDDDEVTAFFRSFDVLDDPKRTTIKLIREMKRNSFSPDTKINLSTHYEYERIDLQVYVGKGKDITLLGTASVSVCGDEEEEVIANVPVKPIWNPNTNNSNNKNCTTIRRKKRNNNKNRKQKHHNVFTDDKYVYSLADNATLRIGIRVVPQRLRKATEKWRATKKRISDETNALYESIILEMNDTNSLIAEINALDRLVKKNNGDDNNNINNCFSDKVQKGMRSNYFCNAICSPLQGGVDSGGVEYQHDTGIAMTTPKNKSSTNVKNINTKNNNNNNQKEVNSPAELMRCSPSKNTMTEARVLPFNAFSDVSDSTMFWSDEDDDDDDDEFGEEDDDDSQS